MYKLMQGLDTISAPMVLCPRHYSLSTTLPSLQLPGGRLEPGEGQPLLQGNEQEDVRKQFQVAPGCLGVILGKTFSLKVGPSIGTGSP